MDDATRRITSLQNDRVKALVRLRKRRERDRQQLMLIEEPLVIARALAESHPLTAVYCCPELLRDGDRDLLGRLRDAAPSVVEMSAEVMAKVSYRDLSEGLLVVAPQRRFALEDLCRRRTAAALLVVLEGVEKPGNLGAVLRVADGAGADGVVVCGQGTDLFNPNVLRASRGACFSVPTVVCELDDLAPFLAANGVRLLATSPAAPLAWDEADYTGPVAIALGTEHDGLSDGMRERADATVGIPMLGRGDSLNVASSAAVMLYEARRQRRART